MAKLQCKVCGGSLVLNESGSGSTCESCGTKYTDETVEKILVEVVGTTTDESLAEYGMSVLDTNVEQSCKAFRRALEINHKNWKAWYGIFLVRCRAVDTQIADYKKRDKHICVQEYNNNSLHRIIYFPNGKHLYFGIYHADQTDGFINGKWDFRELFAHHVTVEEAEQSISNSISYCSDEKIGELELLKKAWVIDAKYDIDQYVAQHQSLTRGNCYIATAVYGSYDALNVMTLRKFRDEELAKTTIGRAFIKTYYRLSPPFAEWLRGAKRTNALVKRVLDWIVAKLGK